MIVLTHLVYLLSRLISLLDKLVVGNQQILHLFFQLGHITVCLEESISVLLLDLLCGVLNLDLVLLLDQSELLFKLIHFLFSMQHGC